MPLLGTRGAASAKGFGFTNAVGGAGYTPADTFSVVYYIGTSGNWTARQQLYNVISGSLLLTNDFQTGVSTAYTTVSWNGNNTGYGTATNYNYLGAINSSSSSATNAGITLLSSQYQVTCSTLSSSIIFITEAANYRVSTNGGTSWTTGSLSTLLGITVGAAVAAVVKNSTLYLIVFEGPGSGVAYTGKVYKTTNGTSFSYVANMGVISYSTLFWKSVYDYTAGIIYIYNQGSGGQTYSFNVDTETVPGSSPTYDTNITSFVYLKSSVTESYWGYNNSNELRKSSNLSTWTTVYAINPTNGAVKKIVPMKDRILIYQGDGFNNKFTSYNVTTGVATVLISLTGVDFAMAATSYTPVNTGDSFWQWG